MKITDNEKKLIITLMKSTNKFISKSIINTNHKKAYNKGIAECFSILEDNWSNLEIIKQKMHGVAENVDFIYKTSFFNTNFENKKHYLLACHHVLSIINSIELRFITGYSLDEETNVL